MSNPRRHPNSRELDSQHSKCTSIGTRYNLVLAQILSGYFRVLRGFILSVDIGIVVAKIVGLAPWKKKLFIECHIDGLFEAPL